MTEDAWTESLAFGVATRLEITTAAPASADFAFVFGTRLVEPAHIAADLWERGIARRIVLTGGPNRASGVVEARAHLDVLLQRGVPREWIVVEDASTNTGENVTLALPLMLACGGEIGSVIAVAKWYHCRRAIMSLRRHLPPGVRYYATTNEPDDTTHANWWHSEAGRERVLKEWRHIAEYVRLGYIAGIREDSGAYV